MKSLSLALVLSALAGFAQAFDLSSGSLKCMWAIKKYGSCLYNLSENLTIDFTAVCSKFDGDNCKEFIKDVYNPTTDCEGQEDSTVDNLIKRVRYVYIAGCSKDESGNLCPLTEIIQNKLNAKIDADIVNKSCSSEHCKKQITSMVDLLPSTRSYVENQTREETEQIPTGWIDSTYKDIDFNPDTINNYLNSEVCSKYQQNNSTDVNANAATDANGNPVQGNQQAAANANADANANANTSAAILGQNANLVFVSILLIALSNLLF